MVNYHLREDVLELFSKHLTSKSKRKGLFPWCLLCFRWWYGVGGQQKPIMLVDLSCTVFFWIKDIYSDGIIHHLWRLACNLKKDHVFVIQELSVSNHQFFEVTWIFKGLAAKGTTYRKHRTKPNKTTNFHERWEGGFLVVVSNILGIFIRTPLKINMEPKNGRLEDEIPFQLGDFQVPC